MSTHKKSGDYKNIFCGNCGNLGHTYKKCLLPITSCGVILYKKNENYTNKIEDKYRFLLVQRKDTIAFIEFLRGKYRESDIKYIKKLLEMMTFCEIDKLKKHAIDLS